MKNSPHIVTGIAGSHCLVVFQDRDVYIDAKIESPGFTQVVVKIGGVPRLTIKAVEDQFAPEVIIQLIRDYARDAKF